MVFFVVERFRLLNPLSASPATPRVRAPFFVIFVMIKTPDMKRILLAFALLSCFVCLPSCEKNEEKPKSEEEMFQENLIGLWEYEQTMNMGGIMISMTNGLYLDGQGSGYFSTRASGGTQSQTQHFKYSVKDKVISYYSIEGQNGTAFHGTYSDEVIQLTDTELEVRRTTLLDGMPYESSTIVYTRASL